MGDIVYSSLAALVEALCRVTLMAVFLYYFGFKGFISAMILSGALFCLVYIRRFKTKAPLMFKQNKKWVLNTINLAVIFSIAYCAARYLYFLDTWLRFGIYLVVVAGLFLLAGLSFNPDFRSTVINLPLKSSPQ